MIAALVWKEYREHRNVWLALAALAGLLIGVLFFLLDPPGMASQAAGKHSMMIFAGLVVAGTYGVVCGSMMLADERDGGTLAFLDALTARRTPIWRAKLLLGMLFTLLQAGLIGTMLVPLMPRSVERLLEAEAVYIFLASSVVALEAYLWGFFLSGLFKSALTAAGTGALLVVLLWSISLGAIFAVSFTVFVLRGLFLIVALWGSWRMFCGTDLERAVPEGARLGRLAVAPFVSHHPAWKWLAGFILVLIGVLAPLVWFLGLPLVVRVVVTATAAVGATFGALALRARNGLDPAPPHGSLLVVWFLRLFVGWALALILLIALTASVMLVAPADSPALSSGGFQLLLVVATEALVWGAFFAALLRGLLRYAVPMGGAIALMLALAGTGVDVAAFRLVAWLAALTASALIFVSRTKAPAKSAAPSPTRTAQAHVMTPEAEHPSAGLWPIVWLTLRQGWPLAAVLAAAGLAAAGLAAGFALPKLGVIVWPVFTLLAGLLCGIGVYAAEQLAGTNRFLGDRRLPPGRVWMVKTALWLFLALLVSAAALLPGAALVETGLVERGVRGQSAWELRRLFGESALLELADPTLFLSLWVIYGFAVGQFFGLLCKKPPVAGVLSLLVAPVLAGIWIPSLVGGGLHVWHVFLPPAILLLATRLSFWTWTAGMLHRPRPILAMSALGGLAVLALAGGLWYRVLEVPDLGEPFDVAEFEAGFPTPEQNKAGSAIRSMARLFQERYEESTTLYPPRNRLAAEARAQALQAAQTTLELISSRLRIGPLLLTSQLGEVAASVPYPGERDRELVDPLSEVLEHGWAAADEPFVQQLEFLFAGKWAERLNELPRFPPGVVVDARFTTSMSADPNLPHLRVAANWIRARAMQLQAEGKQDEAADQLAQLLVLSRHLRNRATTTPYLNGRAIEAIALDQFDKWMQGASDSREALRRVLDELTRHETSLPPLADVEKAEYLQAPNEMDAVLREVQRGVAKRQRDDQLLTLAWQTPWEAIRRKRILNALYIGKVRRASLDLVSTPAPHAASRYGWIANETGFDGIPQQTSVLSPEQWALLAHRSEVFVIFAGRDLRPWHLMALARLRGLRIKAALLLYQLDRGRPAETLEQLVPEYWSPVPRDPFLPRAPFNYRLSQGEFIAAQQRSAAAGSPVQPTPVPSGWGIVWSAGLDLVDNGGHSDASALPVNDSSWQVRQADLIFLVPNWTFQSKKPSEKGAAP